MKFKTFMIAALAAVVGMTACSKEEAGKAGDGQQKTVFVTVTKQVENRAIGSDVPDQTEVTLTTGKIFFTNSAYKVTHVIEIVAGSGTYNGTTVGEELLDAGAVFEELDPTTTNVYLVGNLPSTVTIAKSDDLSAKMISVASQYAADGGLSKVTIAGGKPLSKKAGGAANDYEAKFDVTPIVSRIEIGEIVSSNANLTFDVVGVFANKYHDQMNLLGASATGNVKNNGMTVEYYAKDGQVSVSDKGSYTAALEGAVYDYNATGLTAPGAGKSWAYNLVAPLSGDQTMFSIVIRLANVKISGVNVTPTNQDQFLTIRNFYKDPSGTKTKITVAEQGHVYHINSVSFDEDDITIQPEMKTINATVTATILKWKTDLIGYDFN